MDCFYFGCFKERGHFLYTPQGRQVYDCDLPQDFPVREYVLDGGLLAPRAAEVEGRAVLVHINGWTILTFWDRSLDSRGASSSSFVMRSQLTFEQAVEKSRLAFPTVWARFPFKVIPSEMK